MQWTMLICERPKDSTKTSVCVYCDLIYICVQRRINIYGKIIQIPTECKSTRTHAQKEQIHNTCTLMLVQKICGSVSVCEWIFPFCALSHLKRSEKNFYIFIKEFLCVCVCVPPSFTRYDSVWVLSFFHLFLALLTTSAWCVCVRSIKFSVRLVGFDTDVLRYLVSNGKGAFSSEKAERKTQSNP